MVGQVGMYGEALPQFSPLSRTGCGDRAGGAQPTGPGVMSGLTVWWYELQRPMFSPLRDWEGGPRMRPLGAEARRSPQASDGPASTTGVVSC
jgi:hypothetical protein